MATVDRKAVLKGVMGRHPGISKTDLQKRVKDHMTKNTASKELADLEKDGEITVRKEGKKLRHFLREAEEDRLNEDLAAALDGYVEELRAMKGEMETYSYDLLNAFNNEIPRQRDHLMQLKKGLEDEMKFEHTVEDVMRDYNEMYGDIADSLGMFRGLVDGDTDRKIHECMTAMSGHLMQKATRRFESRTKRESCGTSKTRDSLTKEIDQLGSDMDKILGRAADLKFKLADIKRIKPRELRHPLAPRPVRWLQRVEEGRTGFQSLVEDALNAKAKTQDDETERWRDAEAGLNRIMGQLSDMKDGLAKTEEAVIKSYIDADLHKQQKWLQRVEEGRAEFQRLVEKALNAKTEMQGNGIKRWRDAEAGLNRIMEQLSDMKDGLAKTEEAVIKSYMDAILCKQQKELSSLVEETLEMYRP